MTKECVTYTAADKQCIKVKEEAQEETETNAQTQSEDTTHEQKCVEAELHT